MIIIYDFDGTLTPYSLPQYPVIKKCGYNDEMLMARIQSEMQTGVISIMLIGILFKKFY